MDTARPGLTNGTTALPQAISLHGNPQPTLPLLPHWSFNEDGESTIILLHGLCSSPLEYHLVYPRLIAPSDISRSYHVLIPHLPCHGPASDIVPFSLPFVAELLAHLIAIKARNGKAHVVGLSAGGFAAKCLAKEYPDVVLSLFVTGVGGLIERAWVRNVAPYVLLPVTAVQTYAPEWAYQWVQRRFGLKIPDGLREAMWANSKLQTLRSAYKSIGQDGAAVPLEIRTLVVAGGKQDSIEGTAAYAKEVRKGNAFSQGCVVKDAIHAWDLQFPELFASGVRAWIEQTELPSGYTLLSTE